MKKQLTVDGNEACSYTSYMFTEVAGIYPITPSSPMAEHLDEWSNSGRTNIFGDKVKVVEMQSEAGAAGLVHGSLEAGCLTSTYTSSQGLLLMIPNMYKIAGEMLPGVINVAARSLSTHALSIFGDHQDIYATRQTGFCMLASSSVQDATYLAAIAHLSAIKASLPFLHFFDGFRTSHEIQKINVLEKEDYSEMLDYAALEKFRKKALNPFNPVERGTAQNDDIYFQATEARTPYYDDVPDIVAEYMNKINKKADTNYLPFNYYGSSNATKVIVAMGSVCETIKETIDALNQDIGLIEVHLYRPFSKKHLINVLPKSVKNIAVLDRTKEFGSIGEPLYLDINVALKEFNLNIVGGRYGLSSKNTTPSQIKAVYDMLDNPVNNFTIGIDDDVNNNSLKLDTSFKTSKSDEILIYGYGSDGMVSASKLLIKLIGNLTDKYVQGYFEYDSKKSGGVTKSHLRFSDNIIRSTYYVDNPKVVVVTKDNYLNIFDVINNIKENGIFVLNTNKSIEELNSFLPTKVKKIITNKNIKFYIINAYELATKLGLDNKISTIIESIIIKLSNLVDYDLAKDEMKNYAKNRYFKKGDKVIEANYAAIDEAINYLVEVKIDDSNNEVENKEILDNICIVMQKRLGNELKVSAFSNNPDGTFICENKRLDNRLISNTVPFWVSSNCIECNQCSFVCPHAVIRPYILSKDEYNKAPEYVKNRCKEMLGNSEYYFIIGISVRDCTGCGLCMNICPGKKGVKALIGKDVELQIRNKEQEIFDYLSTNISLKDLFNANTVKGCGFKTPKFMFHGACAGCGEPNYIKILTQLYGDSMIIANATGCSSIYGGSVPTIPYNVPWASSLFEDNAEYGYGILTANNYMKKRIYNIMQNNLDNPNKELFTKWMNNYNDYNITKEVYDKLDYSNCPKELALLKDYIPKRNIFIIGGDGWAYDIGFGGIDHVLASNENVNILVLDTQIYSNTGGQSSKSSPKGSIASFTSNGKKTNKKDLARMALSYPNVYVAQVSLGYNFMTILKVFKEAVEYNGPSIIIAYSPCISHGITGGMVNSVLMQKKAVECGYYPIFHYNPDTNKFIMDSKNVDFDAYDDFLNSQSRYAMLKKINPEHASKLLKENKEDAINRYNFYKNLETNIDL